MDNIQVRLENCEYHIEQLEKAQTGMITGLVALVVGVLVRSDRQWRKAMNKLAAYQKEKQAILDKRKQDTRTDEEVLRRVVHQILYRSTLIGALSGQYKTLWCQGSVGCINLCFVW